RHLLNGMVTDSLNWLIYGFMPGCSMEGYRVTTSDGGKSWTETDTLCPKQWPNGRTDLFHTRGNIPVYVSGYTYDMSVDLYDSSKAIMVEPNAKAIRWTKPGQWNWLELSPPDNSTPRLIASVDSSVWYLVTNSGNYLSNDDAITWQRLDKQPPLKAVKFAGHGKGFGAGIKYGYFYTSDSGRTWRTIAHRSFNDENRVWVFNDSTAYFWGGVNLIQVFGIDTAYQPLINLRSKGRVVIIDPATEGFDTIIVTNYSALPVTIDSVSADTEGYSIIRSPSIIQPWASDSVIVRLANNGEDPQHTYVTVFSNSAFAKDSIYVLGEYARLFPLLTTRSINMGSQFIGDSASTNVTVSTALVPLNVDKFSTSTPHFSVKLTKVNIDKDAQFEITYR
ncbi:MAG TPA: hypothetical protein VEF04_03595, partial [Blastocatellia bacterium]|nr:hypothetical protein [Blastocatellia bacterium]